MLTLKRARPGLSGRVLATLFFGQITEVKGIENLLQAFPILSTGHRICDTALTKKLLPSLTADAIALLYHHIYQSGALLMALSYAKLVVATCVGELAEH